MLGAARAVLLAGPFALAFWSGGYFDEPRTWCGLAAWGLVALAVAGGRSPVPRPVPARIAVGGLLALAGWTFLSILWAPVAGGADHAGQLVLLYGGGLLAAVALLRGRAGAERAEPALAAGAVLVVAYGVSERLVPGVLHFARSASADGRLEQPLTYWNAVGELAALALVLLTRLAGRPDRPAWLRAAAAAAAPIAGLGLYLSFSRGALFAALAGLVALLVAAPTRAQLRAVGVAVAGTVIAVAVAAPLAGVTHLAGTLAAREREGAAELAALLLAGAGAAVATGLLARHESDRDAAPRPLPSRAGWLAAGLITAGLAVAIMTGSGERSGRPIAPGAARLVTFRSDRYAYWRVALDAFADEPLHGVGAGGWAVAWLRERPFRQYAVDAHSLPLQTLAELGAVGAALLLLVLGGVARAAAQARRAAPAAAAGPIAALVAYLAHAPLDWDWQMPAVTLVAVVLSGVLLTLGDPATAPRRSAAPRG